MERLYNLVKSSFKKYSFTIIGSVALVIAWYYEKQIIDDLTEKRASLQNQYDVYQIQLNDMSTESFHVDFFRTKSPTDSPLLLLYIARELLFNEHMKDLGAHLRKTGNDDYDEKRLEHAGHKDYWKNAGEIEILYAQRDFKSLLNKLDNARQNNSKITIDDQNFTIQRIEAFRQQIKKTRIYFLILYVVGILFISISRIKSTLDSNENESETMQLLKKIKTQVDDIKHSLNKKIK